MKEQLKKKLKQDVIDEMSNWIMTGGLEDRVPEYRFNQLKIAIIKLIDTLPDTGEDAKDFQIFINNGNWMYSKYDNAYWQLGFPQHRINHSQLYELYRKEQGR